jgi:hypothetical protein
MGRGIGIRVVDRLDEGTLPVHGDVGRDSLGDRDGRSHDGRLTQGQQEREDTK